MICLNHVPNTAWSSTSSDQTPMCALKKAKCSAYQGGRGPGATNQCAALSVSCPGEFAMLQINVSVGLATTEMTVSTVSNALDASMEPAMTWVNAFVRKAGEANSAMSRSVVKGAILCMDIAIFLMVIASAMKAGQGATAPPANASPGVYTAPAVSPWSAAA